MIEEFRSWIHRHLHIVLSFAIGVTVGISILALVYFSSRNGFAAGAVRFGARITGHPDISEDMVWFISGIVVGASVACLAWWRDVKAQSADLEKADVLNRLTSDPKPPPVPSPKQ